MDRQGSTMMINKSIVMGKDKEQARQVIHIAGSP